MALLMVEALDAYLYLMRMTRDLAEAEDADVGVIAAKAALGDSKAIGDLYMRYVKSLTRIAAAFVGAEADDVVQDVFLKLSQGKFAGHAQKWSDGRTAWASLATAVKNAAINTTKAKKPASGGGGVGATDTSDDPKAKKLGSVDPEAEDDSLPDKDRSMVLDLIQRAKETAKLSPDEKDFVDLMFSAGEFSGRGDAASITDLAMKIWPNKKQNAAQVSATRAKKRFFKQLCQDPDLKKLAPAGRVGFSSVCDEQDPVVRFAVEIGLISLIEAHDSDKAYDEVLRWMSYRVT